MSAEPEQLRLFNGFALVRRDRTVQLSLASRRVLCFLALRGRCGRTEVSGTLWPDVSETRALASLRTVLWRIRNVRRDLIVATLDWIRLADDVAIDVHAFRETVARLMHQQGGEDLPPLADLTVGDLLPGWYDDWVILERESVRLMELEALETLADRLLDARRPAEATRAAWTAVRLDPLRESATHVLVRAHLARRNLIEAVRAYRNLETVLWHELGARPSPELAQLLARPTASSRTDATRPTGRLDGVPDSA
jgi:DNA-binding SARP family transcriptional activator